VFGRKTTLALLTGTLVAAGTVGGGAAVWAASAKPTAPGDQIHACAGRHGILRLAFHDHCGRREFPIAWNRQGPAGPPGPALNPTPLQSIQVPPAPPIEFVPTTTPAFTPLTGLSVSLQPGTYLINVDLRGVINSGAPNGCGLTGRLAFGPTLATATTPVPNSQRLVLFTPATITNLQGSASIHVIYTAIGGAPTVVQAQAARVGTGNSCAAGTGIATDANGASAIDAVRIN
jgi:hypothetical protein